MKLSDFDYNLPPELIAQERVKPYENAKLLVFDPRNNLVLHQTIADLPRIIDRDTVLVFNNSRVIPARLHGRKPSGGRVEILLLRPQSEDTWLALVRPGKSLQIGTQIYFSDDLQGDITGTGERGERAIHFSCLNQDLMSIIDNIGEMPTPPYIHQKLDQQNYGDYQTCYADLPGSSAAPTAGLHFTPDLLSALRNKGIQTEFVTLHVGLGTFAPIADEDIGRKRLHVEYFSIDPETAQRLNQARKAGKKIIAVGTTTVRALESATDARGVLQKGARETDIFIQPGDKFHFINGLLTNFHLPQSSLLMLVSALVGREKLLELYDLAVRQKYRFFSFGDAMLILPPDS